MIFGPGITASISYTHRRYRERQAEARARIATIKFRHQQCAKLEISYSEYMRRLAVWRDLRGLVAQIMADNQYRSERETVVNWMTEKVQFRTQNRVRLQREALERKAKAQFQSYIGAPVTEMKKT